MPDYTEDYLLDKKIKIFQPNDGYRAAIDAVLLSAAVEKLHPGDNILDMGSGTGAVSLCLAQRFFEIAPQIIGVELQPVLAELSNMSAEANNFSFLKYINASIFDCGLPFCSFAHVVTNPPYFEQNMPTSPKAGKATAHNFSQTSLAQWINLCIKMIKPQGYFYMVNRAQALDEILNAIGTKLGDIKIFPIYSKAEQDAKRVIIRAKKDSKAPLSIAAPIIIHQADGSYSQRAEAILRGGKSL